MRGKKIKNRSNLGANNQKMNIGIPDIKLYSIYIF